jgi:hypothetical protein
MRERDRRDGGYPKWIGERAGSILDAMTTTELVPVELAVALVVSVLGGDCWDGWGRGGGDVGGKPARPRGCHGASAARESVLVRG